MFFRHAPHIVKKWIFSQIAIKANSNRYYAFNIADMLNAVKRLSVKICGLISHSTEGKHPQGTKLVISV